MTKIEDSRWRTAQTQEFATWKLAAASRVAWSGALQTAVELYQWLAAVGFLPQRDERFLEIGIGPLSVGFIALFGSLESKYNIAVDTLPRLPISTGDSLIDEFTRKPQERVDMRCASADAMDWVASGSCDWVICDNVLDHTADPGGILKEMRRVVRPGGRIVVTVHCYSRVGLVKRRLLGPLHPNDLNRIMHPQSFTIASAETMLEAYGFQILASSRKEKDVMYEWLGRLRLLRWVLEPVEQ